VDRRRERDLLDVHVVHVEVGDDIRPVDLLDEGERLLSCVEDVGLVAVAELQPESDVGGGRLVGEPGDRLDRVARPRAVTGAAYRPSLEKITPPR